tara:strand:+ start:100 stop:711 length:612 start_codon:yes stop_codon:yes gene_type:complete
MKNYYVHRIFSTIGILFVILGILAYYNGIINSGLVGVLWFSYTALFLIGIGILTRNSYLIASQINIILIPYIVWNIDFFYILITSESLWGITNYFFTSRPILSQIITLQHLFIIPVSLISLYFIKLKRNDFWKLSFIEIIIFFLLIKIINPAENINCIFESCLPFQITFMPYTITWFLSYITIIFLTNIFLVKSSLFTKNEKS